VPASAVRLGARARCGGAATQADAYSALAAEAVRSLVEGTGGTLPSAVEVTPGAHTAATSVRATMAANSPGHHAPALVIDAVPAMSLV
jgi:hypothetical protein